MSRVAALIALAVLASCASVPNPTEGQTITNFDKIDLSVGRKVLIEGYVSRTHGASGIYFNLSDLRQENGRCLVPQPFVDTPHGERAILSGVVQETGCGTDKICTNICGEYLLAQATVLSN